MRDGEWKRSSWLEKWPLALLYREADKLLDALPVLLLGGAAAVVLTWLTHGRLGFPHLLVHSRQTQPGGGEKTQADAVRGVDAGTQATRSGRLSRGHSQGDDVGVGGLHGDAQGVVALLVRLCLRRSSLQEETHLTVGAEGRDRI